MGSIEQIKVKIKKTNRFACQITLFLRTML